MNICDIWNRGAAHAPKPPAHPPAVVKAAEAARRQWLNALQVDQTRAWLDIGASQPEVLNGLASVLTIAGFAQVFDTRNVDGPDIRVIRGAISTAEGCTKAGDVITVAAAKAFSAAADRAVAIIQTASVAAIIHAAESIRRTVGLQ